MRSPLHRLARVVVAALLTCAVWTTAARGADDASEPRVVQESDAVEQARLAPLRLVEHVSVLVEDLTPDAEGAGVTRERIEADAAGRLRVAGLRVTGAAAPFPPMLYLQVSVLCNTTGLCAIDVSSAVVQDVYLLKGAPRASQARTWATGRLLMAPRALVAERVREVVREQTDLFATDVLAARQQAARSTPSVS